MTPTLALVYTVLSVLAIVFSPLALIWSLNTLFHAGIVPTLATWLAALFINGLMVNRGGGKK